MVKRLHIPLILLIAFSLSAIGCGVPQEDYKSLQQQYDSLQKEYDSASSKLSSVQKDFDVSKAELSSARAELSSTQDQLKKLQSDLTAQAATLTQTKSSNESLQKQLAELENKLNATLETEIKYYDKFTYQFVEYNWTLPIPLKSYLLYKQQPRPVPPKYDTIIIDSRADEIMNKLINYVKNAAGQQNLRRSDIANLIAKFTGTLSITDGDVIAPYDSYTRYPVETLFDQGGDCEDTSILAAALLKRQDFDVVLFVFEKPKHIAVGIYLPGTTGDGWEYQDKKYLHLETVAGGGVLGSCPYIYQGVRPLIIPIGQ